MNVKKIVIGMVLIYLLIPNSKVKAIEYKTSNVEESLIISFNPITAFSSDKTIAISEVDRVNENLNNAISNFEEEKARLEKEELERKLKEEAEARIKAEKEARRRQIAEFNSIMQNNVSENLANTDIYSLAQNYVGRPGDCFQIATQFINEYFGSGKTSNGTYQVSDPQPGDLIYYAEGGLGTTHYAVYLGDGQALQGNYNGTTVIAGVYLTNASNPVYYRYN